MERYVAIMLEVYLFIGAIYLYINSDKIYRSVKSQLRRDDVAGYQLIVAGILIILTHPIFIIADRSFTYKD